MAILKFSVPSATLRVNTRSLNVHQAVTDRETHAQPSLYVQSLIHHLSLGNIAPVLKLRLLCAGKLFSHTLTTGNCTVLLFVMWWISNHSLHAHASMIRNELFGLFARDGKIAGHLSKRKIICVGAILK